MARSIQKTRPNSQKNTSNYQESIYLQLDTVNYFDLPAKMGRRACPLSPDNSSTGGAPHFLFSWINQCLISVSGWIFRS